MGSIYTKLLYDNHEFNNKQILKTNNKFYQNIEIIKNIKNYNILKNFPNLKCVKYKYIDELNKSTTLDDDYLIFEAGYYDKFYKNVINFKDFDIDKFNSGESYRITKNNRENINFYILYDNKIPLFKTSIVLNEFKHHFMIDTFRTNYPNFPHPVIENFFIIYDHYLEYNEFANFFKKIDDKLNNEISKKIIFGNYYDNKKFVFNYQPHFEKDCTLS